MIFQLAATPTLAQIVEGFANCYKYGHYLKLSITIASFFNLDFGRIYYTFCLNPTASAVGLKSLDYGIFVFPVFLILVTNLFVKLHSNGVRPVVWCWSAIVALKTSLIDVFASLLYLSSSRLLITSIHILMPVEVY